MKVYILTPVGESLASSPSNSGSNAMRILYYLRRHGKQASDSQILDHLGLDGMELRRAMGELEHNQAVKCVVSS